MTFSKYPWWRGVTALMLLHASLWLVAKAAAQQKASPQEMLDFLAKPAVIAGKPVLPPGYPSHYSDWTEDQKKAAPQIVALRCGLVFSLEHDNPSVRMLPQAMSMRDESRLASDVCFVSNMPDDFSGRAKFLADANSVIADANAHGASLHLPSSLKR